MHARGASASGPAAAEAQTAAAGTDDSATATTGAASVEAGGSAAPTTDAGGRTAPPAGSGAKPCAAPSTAPGVTASTIRIGSISSLSGPSPGLGLSSLDATRAYVAYRNSTGGVCGRKVVLDTADDGTEGGRYRAIVTEMIQKDLGIMGGFTIGDVGGLDLLEQKKMPNVGIPSDDNGTAVSTFFDINPPYENPDAVIGKYKYLYDHGVRTVTAVYLAVAQSRFEAQRQERLMKAAGIRLVDVQELPLSTLSYDAPARRVANSKADYLFYIGDSQGNAAMARSMAGVSYKPKFSEYFTFAYGSAFIQQAGEAAAEGVTTWLRALPNEDAGSNAELARFVQWMGRTAPESPLDPFAADGWVASKAFLDNLEALPGPISREALVAQLRSVGTFDAGGMFGPIRLGRELNDGCFIGMQVRDGRWKRLTPASGFLC